MLTFQNRSNFLIMLFASTLFSSALLMFVLQPLFGKLLLPLLGGTPAVWNSCMVFYQSILFLGYLYAHLLGTRLKSNHQIIVHLAVISLSFLALPVSLPENLIPPTEGNPTLWLFSTLALAIGLPFFVLSTTAPLIQKWFAHVGHHNSHDPYFLYAASNTGSLVSLLSYPFLIEPNWGLNAQQSDWTLGYVGLCLLIAACGFALWKNYRSIDSENATISASNAPPLSWKTKFYWGALAFVPSSLLLGLTNFISTDIASVPLLWIIPLTVYLFSFVVVFSRWNDKSHAWFVRLQPVFLIPFVAYAFINPADLPYWMYLFFHVIAFFFAIMVCHGELAAQRPHSQHLTTYYLIMSFAGMLGGMFNTFVAPFVFNGIYEYPLMIIAALLLRPSLKKLSLKETSLQLIDPILLLIIGAGIYFSVSNLTDYFDGVVISLCVLTIGVYFLRQRVVAYAGLMGVIISAAMSLHHAESHTLMQERTFFGVMAVRESVLTDEKGQPETYHELFHGTTKHGAQRLIPTESKTPLTYYSRPSPMGQLFKTFDAQNANWNIGVVGLGAGALACYAKPSQTWTLYEIDPLVVDIAKNPAYFSYLSQCAPNAVSEIGDARLSIQNKPDGTFDLLMMDAFSSDAVPTHLLTREAIDLYFKKLKPNGILAFHITNRHLLLKKVVSIHAEQMKLAALIQEFKPQTVAPLIVATDWVVLAKNPETLKPLQASQIGSWQKMPLYFDMPAWTDDFTNIVSIWK
ncbi:MAG: fused MFS/spermidine synthase [Methylococcales bacterium]|nr:fused MFS/spermidine synthase [Methylococcales bacterium]